MQLPIDISKIKKATSEIVSSQKKEFGIDVYVDESANPDLIGYISLLITPKFKTATVNYFTIYDFDENRKPDYCVIIAGNDDVLPAVYHGMRANRVPCVVASIEPHLLYEMDASFKKYNNRKNIVCPKFKDYSCLPDGELDFNDLNNKMMNTLKAKFVD